MRHLIAAASAAIVLAFGGSGSAATVGDPTLATFQSIGNDPILRFDYTPGQGPGGDGYDVDTISPAGVPNVMFQWERREGWSHPAYDFIDPFVALGPLQAIFTMSTTPFGLGYDAKGSFEFAYAGPDITVGNRTFSSGARLLYGTIFFDTGLPYSYARSDFFMATNSASYFEFNLVNPTWQGDVVTGGLSGSYLATVPEPATWAMMIIGFGLVGSVVRRRQPKYVSNCSSPSSLSHPA